MFRRRTLLVLMIAAMTLAAGCAPDPKGTFTVTQKERLNIGATGTNIPIVKKLAEAFMEKHKDVAVDIPAPLGPQEIEQNIENGNLEVAFTSGLADRMAHPELKQYPFARTVIVFAVNPSVPVSGLSSGQVLDIFTGRITNWRYVGGPDRRIVVLTRAGGETTKKVIDNYIRGFAAAKIPDQTVRARNFQAMNEGITSIRDSIGWTDLGAVKAEALKVKPLAIDGVIPSVENCRAGKYPLTKVMYVLVKGEPAGNARELVDFVLGWEGQKVILENGYMIPGNGSEITDKSS